MQSVPLGVPGSSGMKFNGFNTIQPIALSAAINKSGKYGRRPMQNPGPPSTD